MLVQMLLLLLLLIKKFPQDLVVLCAPTTAG